MSIGDPYPLIPFGTLIPQNPYIDMYGNTQYWNGSSWQSTQPSNSNNNTLNNGIIRTIGNEIYIFKNDCTSLPLLATLDKIMSRLGMISPPDHKLMEKYPSLKAAYEEYQLQFSEVLAEQHPKLKHALDSLKLIESIVKEEENG